VASPVRLLGDIDLAEESVQEAFAIATERWPVTGPPSNPGVWIVTTARNRAIDRVRREASRHRRQSQSALLHAADRDPEEIGAVGDDRLRATAPPRDRTWCATTCATKPSGSVAWSPS